MKVILNNSSNKDTPALHIFHWRESVSSKRFFGVKTLKLNIQKNFLNTLSVFKTRSNFEIILAYNV